MYKIRWCSLSKQGTDTSANKLYDNHGKYFPLYTHSENLDGYSCSILVKNNFVRTNLSNLD